MTLAARFSRTHEYHRLSGLRGEARAHANHLGMDIIATLNLIKNSSLVSSR